MPLPSMAILWTRTVSKESTGKRGFVFCCGGNGILTKSRKKVLYTKKDTQYVITILITQLLELHII